MRKHLFVALTVFMILAGMTFVFAFSTHESISTSDRKCNVIMDFVGQEKGSSVEAAYPECAVPKTGDPCTSGDSFCQDRSRGGWERMCNCNTAGVCTWGEETSCGSMVMCSSTGWGGRC